MHSSFDYQKKKSMYFTYISHLMEKPLMVQITIKLIESIFFGYSSSRITPFMILKPQS